MEMRWEMEDSLVAFECASIVPPQGSRALRGDP
jgi:hypothetical protein